MDILLTFVLNLVRVADLAHTDQAVLTFVAPDDIVTGIFSGMLSDEECKVIADALQEITGRDVGIMRAFERINDIVALIKAQTINNEPAISKITEMNSMLEDLLTLRYMTNATSINHIDVTLENIRLFNYIQTIHIVSEQDGPYHFVIGTISKQQQDIQVHLSNNSYIERKIEITHSRSSPYPKLNLKTPSKCQVSNKHNRFDWFQRGSPEYDLEVYTYVQRRVGSILTRQHNAPYHITGRHMSLTIPDQDGATLLVTNIRNEKDVELMNCIRMQTAM